MDSMSPAFSASQMQATHSTTSTDFTMSSNGHFQPIRKPDLVRKIVVTGDGGCGKTCLLIVYSQDRFPTDYIPTVFETYSTQVQVANGKLVEVALWDTAGQEEYDRLRPLSYQEASVVFICFAVDYPPSLYNVTDKWHPEVAHFCEGVPVWLVANKIDLRADKHTKNLLAAQGQTPITFEQGMAVAKSIGAKYAECSAKSRTGVDELFQAAIEGSIKSSSRSKMRGKLACTIL